MEEFKWFRNAPTKEKLLWKELYKALYENKPYKELLKTYDKLKNMEAQKG